MTDKLKMHTPNLADENFKKLAALFPNAVTETINEDGEVVRAIDADVLRQEISATVVEGSQERYQFTWPDKKKSVVLANQPIAKTLRLVREKSVGRDGTPGSIDTENIYIEGDNLDALKLLQETYLGKVKMIYIDPPYNTGNDFVYEDDFSQDADEYMGISGQFDDEGNRLVQNTESNGRFHTDWLNMMYPRLRIAKDLLSDDGIIFISIGDEEIDNLRKICDEVFGADNFRNQITVRRGAKSVQAQFETWDKLGKDFEYILMYTRNSEYRFPQQLKPLSEKKAGTWNNHWRGTDRPTMRYPIFGITPRSGQWRWGEDRSKKAIINYAYLIEELGENPTQEQIDLWYEKQNKDIDLLRLSINGKPEHYIPPTNTTLLNSSWNDLLVGSSSEIFNLFNTKVFDTAKLTIVIKRMLNFVSKDSIILDFFSGSATTAHAVMQLNAEDGGHRKFIMVQLPEVTEDNSEARKAGYKTICDIGEERIRRAGKKILAEHNVGVGGGRHLHPDVGFRVFRVDSSNMKDVYYRPKDTKQGELKFKADNIKEDRTSEDLLFQVMLDLGVLLSSKIEENTIDGKKVFSVADDYLIACFDKDVTDETVKAIAQKKPFYAVFRDAGIASDSVMTNFEQIFETYSPKTQRKVL